MNELAMLISAVFLGAFHALEPGHGKTIVAAYLVSSKGRAIDAILLGGVVTFTHTFSIIVLGLLTAVASVYLVPETVHEFLSIISGLLVVGVGLWMVRSRVFSPSSGATHAHSHSHQNWGEHGQASGEAHLAYQFSQSGIPAGLAGGHEHVHGERVSHTHETDHAHSSTEHSHGRLRHSHALPSNERASIGGLITLGISGGIVPCPAALALLLAAVAVGNVLGGVSLVIAFSCGLAAVLIAIGIAFVKGAHLAGRYFGSGSGERSFAHYASVASAILVTALGVLLTARAALDIVGVSLFS